MAFNDGEYSGRSADVTRLLASSINHSVKFVTCPFVECLTMVEQGSADMIVDIRKTADRQEYLSYLSIPLYKEILQMNFYLLKDEEKSINSYSDLSDFNIGVLAGAKYFSQFDLDKSLNKTSTSDHLHLVTLLLRKRIDAFIGREESIKAQAEKYIYENRIRIEPYKIKQEVAAYIAISKKSPLANQTKRLSEHLTTILNRKDISPLFPH
jgi:polar amino acid transport system substrate-binding protein